MTSENRLTVSKLRLTYILLMTFTLIPVLYGWIDSSFHRYGLYIYILSGFFACCFVFIMLMRFNFVYFSDTNYRYELKYYHAFPWFRKYRAIQIPKQNLVKYEIKKGPLALVPRLVLYQHSKQGVVKYPAVSLSALNKTQRQNIITSLDSQNKKQKIN